MNPNQFRESGPPGGLMQAINRHANHAHALPGLSRRRFLQGAAGATAIGATAASGLVRPGNALAASGGLNDVVPIPWTLNLFGVDAHVQAPPFTGDDSEPSTVYNYQGTTAIAFANGMVARRNRKTGEVRELPFIDNDMRFMQGIYRDRKGKLREATFGFI